jgi:S1-C subfamily serine protease
MSKNFQKTLGIIFALATFAQAQTPVPATKVQSVTPTTSTPAQIIAPEVSTNPNVSAWVVSVIHKVDVHKLIERMRKETNARVGIPGSMPEFTFNVTTGVVIDDKGHIVTRLVNLDPEDKNQIISVVTNDGASFPAKFIGLDCPSGFAVLEVPSLPVKTAVAASDVSQGKLVKILSADITPKVVGTTNTNTFDLSPLIKVLNGHIETNSPYAKARGVLTLRSSTLRSRNDSAVVTTKDNQLVGVAQYVGFGRAYLFPIELIRQTIAQRVIEKQATVPTGWLGVTGSDLYRLSPAELSELGIERKTGVLVKEVSPDSPAAASGIKPKDLIIGFDEFDIAGTNDLGAFLSTSPSGRKIKLRTLRNREPLEYNVVLGAKANMQPIISMQQFEGKVESTAAQMDETKRRIEELQSQYRTYSNMPKSQESEESIKELTIELRELYDIMRELQTLPPETPDNPGFNLVGVKSGSKSCTLKAGFTANEMTQQLTATFGTSKSIYITNVNKGSAAEIAGLKAGDVVVGAMGEPLNCAQTEALFAKSPQSLTLKVIRTVYPVTTRRPRQPQPKRQPLSITIKQ